MQGRHHQTSNRNRFADLSDHDADSDDEPEMVVTKKPERSQPEQEVDQIPPPQIDRTPDVGRGRESPQGIGRGRPQTNPTVQSAPFTGGQRGRGTSHASQARGYLPRRQDNRAPLIDLSESSSASPTPASAPSEHKSRKGPVINTAIRPNNARPTARPTAPAKTRSQAKSVRSETVKARDAFPRVAPLNNANAYGKMSNVEREMDERRTIQELRQKPDDDAVFIASGALPWPVKDVDPSNFGADLAKLDEIRRDTCCTIYFDQTYSAFRVYAHDFRTAEEDVSNAINSLKLVLQEEVVHKKKKMRLFMLQPPYSEMRSPVVRILDAKESTAECLAAGVGAVKKVNKIVIAESSQDEALSDWHEEMAIVAAKNKKICTLAMEDCLAETVHRQGFVQIRALFGVFIFHRYITQYPGLDPPASTEPLVPFAHDLRSSITDGSLHRLTGNAGLFECVTNCNDLFDVYGNEECPLRDVAPTQTGFFTFSTGIRDDVVGLQLLVETSPDPDPEEEPLIGKSTWRGTADIPSTRCMEVFMVSPQKGITWKLEVSAQKWHRSIKPELVAFQKSIMTVKPSIENGRKPGSAELVFDFKECPGLIDFYQKTAWRYRLRADSSFIFEISRLDRFDAEKIKNHRKGRLSVEDRMPVQTEWDACVYHERWSEFLGQNATLVTGTKATWDPDLENFFPSAPTWYGGIENRTPGFPHFMKCLEQVSSRLSEALMRHHHMQAAQGESA